MRNQMLGRCPVCNSGLDVTKLHCPHCNTGIEGKFAMCKFCQLPADQKAFAEVFIKCRGNIKEVEKELGISYPTVRSRLETLIESLGYRAQPVPKEDPETKERRKAILEDLNQGKISVEEAQRLLETVGMAQDEAQEPKHREPEPRSIVEDIVETIRTGLSNINFSFGDSGRIVLDEQHSGRFSSEAAELELDVRNGTIRIESWDRDEFRLDVIKKIRAGTREQAEALISRYRFADFDGKKLRAGDQECRGLGNRVNVSLRLFLPRNHVYQGRADSKNGSVEVGGIDTSSFEIHTMNGSVRLNKVSGNRVLARTVNGSLRMEGGMGQVDARTTNGSITLINIAEDSDVNLETVNGRILVQLPIREDIGVGLSARTTAGSVRLEHPYLDIKIDSRRVTGGRSVEAKSENWGEAPHRIALQLRSVNGSITIRELE